MLPTIRDHYIQRLGVFRSRVVTKDMVDLHCTVYLVAPFDFKDEFESLPYRNRPPRVVLERGGLKVLSGLKFERVYVARGYRAEGYEVAREIKRLDGVRL